MEFPLEPLYSIESAVLYIPTSSKKRLYELLRRYKDQLSEPRYMRRQYGRRYRMLTLSDLKTLRELTIKPGFYTGKRSRK
jgi:hypothetical protein